MERAWPAGLGRGSSESPGATREPLPGECGWPSFARKDVRRKTTPLFWAGLHLLDLPRDRYPRPSPEGDHLAWSPSIGDCNRGREGKSRGTFSWRTGGKKESQGPFPVWSLRAAGWSQLQLREWEEYEINPLSEASVPQSPRPKPRLGLKPP